MAIIEDVAVELENDNRSIAALEVKNLTSGILMKSSYTEVNLKLEDIIVTDLNPKTIHTKVCMILKKKIFIEITTNTFELTDPFNCR